EQTGRRMRSLPKATPGSFIEFSVNPTITALTPLSAVTGYSFSENISEKELTHVNTEGLLSALSVDFSRALKDLAAILNDLKRLSTLGDLPITYQASGLRVHFPGCDAETVSNLCDELNVQRGCICQDPDFDAFVGTEIALLFPFAPSARASEAGCEYYDDAWPAYQEQKEDIDWRNLLTPSQQSEQLAYSTQSEHSGVDDYGLVVSNPWRSASLSGYESIEHSGSQLSQPRAESMKNDPLEYQGSEGIYRFMEQCEMAHINKRSQRV
ncbi:hypothetical protein LTR66_005544, partial [Elasticomyces elasticus]